MDRDRGWKAWLRWALFSESLIVLLAVAGPGYRHAVRRDGDRALIARFFIDEPSFLDAVLVNLLALHIFIAGAFAAAWRRKRSKGVRAEKKLWGENRR